MRHTTNCLGVDNALYGHEQQAEIGQDVPERRPTTIGPLLPSQTPEQKDSFCCVSDTARTSMIINKEFLDAAPLNLIRVKAANTPPWC